MTDRTTLAALALLERRLIVQSALVRDLEARLDEQGAALRTA